MGEDTPTSSLANKMDKRRVTSSRGLKKAQLPKLPTTTDLQLMVDDALTYSGQVIELPFRDGQDEYCLTCVAGRKREELQMWAFYIGNAPSAQAALVYETTDLSLLLNMVVCSMPTQSKPGGGMSVEAAAPSPAVASGVQQKGAMEGLLAKMPIPNLLQSLAGADSTGKLVVTRGAHVAVVYFDSGKLVHCESDHMVGEDGVLDLLFWKEGMFNFFPDQKSKVQSVKRRLEGMLMESANLQDFIIFLEKKEIGINTYLTGQVTNEQEYSDLLKNAVPTDAEQQLKFYKSITGSRTLSDLIKEHKYPTSVWIPIVYNLIKYGLVVTSTKASIKSESNTRKIAPVQIDPDVIKIAKKTLIKRETGVYSYPACLLFLEQEQKRFQAYRRPYTLLLIRIRARNENGDLEIPSDEILKEILKIVDKAKRETDILAHYDTYDYALLLPETDDTSGQMIATRTKELVSLFRLSEMGPEYGDQQIDLAIGSASAPVDGETIGEILAMALAKRATLAKA